MLTLVERSLRDIFKQTNSPSGHASSAARAVSSLILRKHTLHLPKLTQDCTFSLLTSDTEPSWEVLGANQKTFRVRSSRICVDRHILSRLVYRWQYVECPEQFRHGQEQIALSEVDAGAESAAGTIAIMVSVFVCAVGELRCKFGASSEMVRIEHFRIFVLGGVVLHSPGVDDHSCALGYQVAIDPVILSQSMRESQRCDRSPSHGFFNALGCRERVARVSRKSQVSRQNPPSKHLPMYGNAA